MKTKQSKILKNSLFINFLLISFLMSLLFGSLMSVILYYYGINCAYALIRNKNQAATNYIIGYFAPLHSTVEYLSKQPEIIYAASDSQRYAEKALLLFDMHSRTLSNINFVYSGYEDGTLLINDYTPPDNFNSKTRPWYKAALESSPAISGGVPYEEAITKEWLISISKVLINKQNKLEGVVVIDTSMDSIIKNLFERDEIYSSSYSYVVDKKGNIIIHHRKDLLGQNFKNIVETKDSFSNQSGRMSYVFEKDSKIAYYTNLDSLGWTVESEVNKSQILHNLLIRILLSMSIVVLASLFVGQVISRILGNKIITPLKTLEQHIIDIIEGKKSDNNQDDNNLISDYEEINTIANGIEKLTHHSLFQKNIELAAKNELLEKLSQTDYLTGILNRRKINEELQKEYQRAKRYDNSTFSIVLLDVDWFKNINDTYGHDKGDIVLKEIVSVISSQLRITDNLARWGGEEFLILCPSTDLSGAATIAKKIQSAIEKNNFSISHKITISGGVCEYNNSLSLDDLIIKADYKLYEAKSKGRNQIIL